MQIGGPGKWAAIRAIYAEMDELIRKQWPWSVNPYGATDWRDMTPIEEDAWNAIRRMGIPFYPQYPVGRYFVDFADPVRRIAVECDGKQWHDAVKDAARDAELRDLGWTVHRFTGRQCFLPESDPNSVDYFFHELGDYYNKLKHWGTV